MRRPTSAGLRGPARSAGFTSLHLSKSLLNPEASNHETPYFGAIRIARATEDALLWSRTFGCLGFRLPFPSTWLARVS